MKIHIIFPLLFIYSICSKAQDCDLYLQGKVTEKSIHEAMRNVYVIIEETQQIQVTDTLGQFQFKNLCPGDYHVKISHIGCKPVTKFVPLVANKELQMELEHYTELLNETIIHGGEAKSVQQTNTLNQENILNNANKSIGEFLSQVQGVSAIKNGNAISKPVIQGLTGNRVGFITNGVPLTSQQWGNDHAPEIDPFAADHISVVKGVAMLEYGNTSANALVIAEPAEITKEPHLHGITNYIFDTNARAHTANVQLTNYNKIVGFNLTGTYKKFGDSKAPNYFLTNTGGDQQNLALNLEKEINKKLRLNAAVTYFETTIGLLAGAFGDSASQVEEALDATKPYRTADAFSYTVEAPKQEVQHVLAKLAANYEFSKHTELKVQYAFQNNQRQEFDRRRGGRTSTPVIDLQKQSQYTEAVFKTRLADDGNLKVGVQLTQNKNENVFGTGTYPLIPDYNSDDFSFFSTYIHRFDKLTYEIGARLSLSSYNVGTAINDIRFFKHNYVNPAVAGGISYRFSKSLKSILNIGYNSRAPQINESYSYGVHQGVAAFEVGFAYTPDGFVASTLKSEDSFKATWALQYNFKKRLFVESLAYVNPIHNYIFLEPQGFVETTGNQGAYQVFAYNQTNALLLGADLRVIYEATDQLSFTAKFAYLYGQDISASEPLIFMSPNNGSLAVNYTLNDSKRFLNNRLNFSVSHTARQNRFVIDKDFAAPPGAYTLLNAGVSTELSLAKTKIALGFKVENILNTAYRSYLNRLRYFADEQGINVSFRLGYHF